MRRTPFNTILARHTLAPAVHGAGTHTGAAVDRVVGTRVYRSVGVVIATGTIADGTHAITIEDSDDGTNFDTAAAADLQNGQPAVTDADDDKVLEFGYTGSKRYVRVVWVQTGGTAANHFAAVVLLGDGTHNPVVHS